VSQAGQADKRREKKDRTQRFWLRWLDNELMLTPPFGGLRGLSSLSQRQLPAVSATRYLGTRIGTDGAPSLALCGLSAAVFRVASTALASLVRALPALREPGNPAHFLTPYGRGIRLSLARPADAGLPLHAL
jgi:hypothetical protein